MWAIWSLAPLPLLKPAWISENSQFTYCWSLAWRISSITLLLDSANLCKAWVVYQTQQKSNRKPCFYCNRYQLKYLPNSFNFPNVIFSRNSKHIKFRFGQTFQEDVLTDFRFLSFPFLSFLLPTWPLNSLTALNSLLGHFTSIKLCFCAYISTSLISQWQGCDFGKCNIIVNVT